MAKAAEQPEGSERQTPSGRLFRRGSGSAGGRRSGVFVDRETGFRGWTATIPGRRELTTPALDAGRLFLGAGFGSYEFYAFDARSGEMLWGQRTRDDGPTAAAVRDGYVAFNTESCTVCVLDAVSGRTCWERWLGDPLLAQPAVADGRVYMAWPARGEHRLGAFDLATGDPLWEAGLTSDVITAPVFSEGDLYTSTYDGQVWCFDAAARKLHAARKAHYLHSKRGTRGFMDDLRADASVGFGSTPQAAKIHLAEHLVGEASVRGAWRAGPELARAVSRRAPRAAAARGSCGRSSASSRCRRWSRRRAP